MALRHKILLAAVIVLAAIGLSPFLAGDAVRLWIWWTARQEKLAVKIERIDAPFLGPITLHRVRVTSLPSANFRIDVTAAQVSVRLNYKRILLRTRDRPLRNISGSDLRAEIHRSANGERLPESTWSTWQKLLPDSANFEHTNVRVENGPVVVILRGGRLSAAEIESGQFSVDEFTIASPLVRQTFSGLRGSTRWQENRLTFAGMTLSRGLDLQSVSVDLAHLSKERVGFDFELDAFGGKIRGNIADEWRPQRSNWTIAASAADLSLTQTGEAVGLTDRIAGRLRAAKLTFRGEPRDPAHATASLWMEVTAPAWRNREADVLMLGATFYNRLIDVQQLYIKQRKNELTLTGEAPLPNTWADWLNADFRANISAEINDVADFASLFGGSRDQFAGELSIDGAIDSHARKISGEVSADGKSMKLFGSPVDLFALDLNIASGVADIADFHLQRKDDFIRVQGKIDLLGEQGLRGTLELRVHDLAEYFAPALPAASFAGRLDFYGRSATFDGAEFGNGLNMVALSGGANFTDLKNITITFRPLSPVGQIMMEGGSDCIDRLELVPKLAPGEPPPRIDHVEMRGSLPGGLHEMKIQTEAGEETYRLLCPENNRPFQLVLPPRRE